MNRDPHKTDIGGTDNIKDALGYFNVSRAGVSLS